jgi:hypothetical protein
MDYSLQFPAYSFDSVRYPAFALPRFLEPLRAIAGLVFFALARTALGLFALWTFSIGRFVGWGRLIIALILLKRSIANARRRLPASSSLSIRDFCAGISLAAARYFSIHASSGNVDSLLLISKTAPAYWVALCFIRLSYIADITPKELLRWLKAITSSPLPVFAVVIHWHRLTSEVFGGDQR